jgi:hypothetical protein
MDDDVRPTLLMQLRQLRALVIMHLELRAMIKIKSAAFRFWQAERATLLQGDWGLGSQTVSAICIPVTLFVVCLQKTTRQQLQPKMAIVSSLSSLLNGVDVCV